MDGQEVPKEKYLEANNATDTDKEFDQQQDVKQEVDDDAQAEEDQDAQIAVENNGANLDDDNASQN